MAGSSQPWPDQPWSRPVVVYSQPEDGTLYAARATAYVRLPGGGTASRACDLVDAAADSRAVRAAIEHLLAAELRLDLYGLLEDAGAGPA